MSLSIDNRRQLVEIAQMAYGHGRGEGMDGGEGRIGMIGNHVVKFNTHRSERVRGPSANADMRESCNLLRAQLLKIADESHLNPKQYAAIRHELGLPKKGQNTGCKTLLDRKVVARVIDMIATGAGEEVKKGDHSEIWNDVDRSDTMCSKSVMTFATVRGRFVKEGLWNFDTKNYDGRGTVTISGNRKALKEMPDLKAIEEKVLKDPVGLHTAHVNMATGMCQMALMREMYRCATKINPGGATKEDLKAMQFFKDVDRLKALHLPGGKMLNVNASYEEILDQMVEAVIGKSGIKYNTLSTEERTKVHIALSLLHQGLEQATFQAYGSLYDKGHSPLGKGNFTILDNGGGKFVLRLERSSDGGLSISQSRLKPNVTCLAFANGNEYNFSNGNHPSMFGKIEVKISSAEVERLSKLDWSKINGDKLYEYEMDHANDNFFYETGLPKCFKEARIDEEYVPRLEVSCATLLNIELE